MRRDEHAWQKERRKGVEVRIITGYYNLPNDTCIRPLIKTIH